MASQPPPLSPHLQVYRFPLTVILSITHRLTGAFLAFGALMLILLLFTIASGPEAYQSAHVMVSSWVGQFLLFLWTFALYFHLCNGIRHLLWDIGYGFERQVLNKSAYAVVIVSTLLTVATWGVAWIQGGAA